MFLVYVDGYAYGKRYLNRSGKDIVFGFALKKHFEIAGCKV